MRFSETAKKRKGFLSIVDNKDSHLCLHINHPCQLKYKMKDGWQMHFYISQLPCGAASTQSFRFWDNDFLFGKKNESSIVKDRYFDAKVLGEGSITNNNGFLNDGFRPSCTVQRKPGRGDATMSASCSDKIAKWNVVGVQGALLSQYLEPVCLSSVTISQYPDEPPHSLVGVEEKARKALYDRIMPHSNKTESLPLLAHAPPPLFCKAPPPPMEFRHSETPHSTPKCGYSVCWHRNGLHEVVLGTTGRRQGTAVKAAVSRATESSLCKKQMMGMFLSIKYGLCCSECAVAGGTSDGGGFLTYRELKEQAQEYSSTWALFKSNPPFSNWPLKPSHLQGFSASVPHF